MEGVYGEQGRGGNEKRGKVESGGKGIFNKRFAVGRPLLLVFIIGR